jgi:hypothetical protein
MPAAQQVAFQPAFDRKLAEHFHDAALRRQFAAIGVLGEMFSEREFDRLLNVRSICATRPGAV